MAGPSSFANRMAQTLAKGEIYKPAFEFVQQLAKELLVLKQEDKLKELVQEMAALARGRIHKDKSLKKWLKDVAHCLDDLQIVERSWISEHVHQLPGAQRVKDQRLYDPDSMTRDVRLAEDPTLERRIEDAATTASSKEEDILLLEDTSMDIGTPALSILDSPNLKEAWRQKSEENTKEPDFRPMEVSQSTLVKAGARPKQLSYSKTKKPSHASGRVISPDKHKTSHVSGRVSSPEKGAKRTSHVSRRVASPDKKHRSFQASRRAFSPDRSSGSQETRRRDRSSPNKDLRSRIPRRTFSPEKRSKSRDQRKLSPTKFKANFSRTQPSSPHRKGRPASPQKKAASSTHKKAARALSPKKTSQGSGGALSPKRSLSPRRRDAADSSRMVSSTSGLLMVTVPKASTGTSTGSTPLMKKEKKCAVPGCQEANRYEKPHAFQFHIPRIFDERLPSDDEEVLNGRKRALRQAIQWLMGRQTEWNEFTRFIRMQRWMMNSIIPVTDQLANMMASFCQYLGEPVPDTFNLSSINSVGCLLHWRVLIQISARMDHDERQYWRDQFPYPGSSMEEPPVSELLVPLPRGFDAHFHLDRTLKAMRLPRNSRLHDVLQGTMVEPDQRIKLEGACAVYCDPDTYPTTQDLLGLLEDMVVAIGVHPRHSSRYLSSDQRRQDLLFRFQELIAVSDKVVVGEVGLDHTEPESDWFNQSELLKIILPLVPRNRVIVLHCRGMTGDEGTEVYMLMRRILKEAVPSQMKIYLHCFSGDGYVLGKWMADFPNLYCGFTRLVGRFNAEQMEALRSVPEDKILLETDAPYFCPPGHQWSAPNQLYSLAELVASHRNTTAESLLETTCSNALALFQ